MKTINKLAFLIISLIISLIILFTIANTVEMSQKTKQLNESVGYARNIAEIYFLSEDNDDFLENLNNAGYEYLFNGESINVNNEYL